MAVSTKLVNPVEVARALRLFIPPGAITEIRALEATHRSDSYRPATWSGYFDDPEKVAAAVAELSAWKGIYFVFNEVDPALLARAANRLKKQEKGAATSDNNILRRRWLLIDLDAVRPAGISATVSEIAAAVDRQQQIDLFLHDHGWPDPIVAESGNGRHLYYAIDLPADDGGLKQRCLESLAKKFDDDVVKVDTSVFNPARITKLFGTLVCKGDSTDDRPHRMAAIVDAPETPEVVPLALLEELAGPPAKTTTKPTTFTGDSFDLESFISRHGLDVTPPAAWKGSGTIWELKTSPLCDHGGDGPYIGKHPDGAIVAGCHHDSCKGRWGWSDLRARFEPKRERVFDGGAHWGEPSTEVDETGEIATCVNVDAYVPFPTHTLPGPVGVFVAAASTAIGCDPSFIALPLLACLARAIGNKRVIRLKPTWKEPAIIWAAIIGKSGSHKTPSLQAAMQFLQRKESESFSAHAEAADKYAQELACYDRDLAAWKKLRNNSEPPPWKPEPPACNRFITSDTTIEALAALLAAQFDGVLVSRDELAGWLGGIAEYKGGKGSDLGHWLAAWSGAPLTVDRKTSAIKMLHVPRAAVSLVGGIQPGVLRSAIGREHMQDGLCARLLMAMPDPRPVRWTDETIDPAVEAAMEGIFTRLLAMEPAADAEGNPEPFPLDLSPAARDLWVSYYNRHRAELAELDDDLAAAWSKLEAYAARFALIFQLAAWAAGGATDDAIGEAAMRAGIELADWFGGEARRVYGLFVETDADREVRDLVDLIRRKGGVITTRELMHNSRKYQPTKVADAALDSLAKAKLGEWHVENDTGGRPRREFRLSPASPLPQVNETGDISTSGYGDSGDAPRTHNDGEAA